MADIKENKGLRGFLKSLIADEESPQEEQKKPEAAIEEKVVEQKVAVVCSVFLHPKAVEHQAI